MLQRSSFSDQQYSSHTMILWQQGCHWMDCICFLIIVHVTLLSWYMDPQSTPAPPAPRLSVCSLVQSWMFDGSGVFPSPRTLLTQNPRRPPRLLVVTADACSCGRACTRTAPWRHTRWAWRWPLPRLRRMLWISTCCRAQESGLVWVWGWRRGYKLAFVRPHI